MSVNKFLYLCTLFCSNITFSQKLDIIDFQNARENNQKQVFTTMNKYTYPIDDSFGKILLQDSLKNSNKNSWGLSISTGLVEFFSTHLNYNLTENIILGTKCGIKFLGGERGSTFLGIVALPTLGIKMNYKFKEFILCPEPLIRINIVGLEIKSIGLLKANYYKDVTGSSYYLFIGRKYFERGAHYFWTFGLSFSRVSNCHDLFFPQFTIGYDFNF